MIHGNQSDTAIENSKLELMFLKQEAKVELVVSTCIDRRERIKNQYCKGLFVVCFIVHNGMIMKHPNVYSQSPQPKGNVDEIYFLETI